MKHFRLLLVALAVCLLLLSCSNDDEQNPSRNPSQNTVLINGTVRDAQGPVADAPLYVIYELDTIPAPPPVDAKTGKRP